MISGEIFTRFFGCEVSAERQVTLLQWFELVLRRAEGVSSPAGPVTVAKKGF